MSFSPTKPTINGQTEGKVGQGTKPDTGRNTGRGYGKKSLWTNSVKPDRPQKSFMQSTQIMLDEMKCLFKKKN